MLKKILALALAIVMLAAVITACGSGSSVASDKNSVVATVGPEPETIDPAMNTSADGAIYINHVFEGLTRLDKNGNTIKGIAKDWKISDDGTKYTFTLRNDAKWSDGQPVTAKDFEYAWKRALAPETASDYATQLYYLKNGEEYNTKKCDADQVGVKATGDYTLEVELKAPTAYFIDLTNFPTYFPVRKDIIEKNGDKWTQSPDTYIGNGPYKVTAWEHNSKIVMEKNDNYWDTKLARNISKIDFVLTDDHPAALSAFENGEHNFNDGLIPTDELPGLIADGKTTPVPELGVNYVTFNVKKAPLDNVKVRKALGMAIDSKFLIEKVLQGGQKSAPGFVPFGMPGLDPKKDFRTEKGAESFWKETADIEGAKKLLAEAGYPDGKGLPELEYSTNANDVNNKSAEALQNMWAQIGVKVKITTMEWKVFLPYRTEKKHTVTRGAWSGDYTDPMTFMDLFITNGPNNDADWSNAEYDKLIKEAQSTNDQKVRMPALHKAEKILMEDAPIVPFAFRNKNSLVDPKLKGVYQSPLGHVFFTYAYWEK